MDSRSPRRSSNSSVFPGVDPGTDSHHPRWSSEMHVATRQKKMFSGLLVGGTVFLLALALYWSGLLTVAELKTLDHRFHRYADPSNAGNDIVLVAVDEASLETYGRWPWSRDRHGYVVHYLKQAGAKVVVFDILFLEPD